MVQAVGLERLERFTSKFYEHCFVDPHIDQFIAEHTEPPREALRHLDRGEARGWHLVDARAAHTAQEPLLERN